MKKPRLTDQQITFALQQAESGTPVEGAGRWVSARRSFFRWKKDCSRLMPSDAHKLKHPEEENHWLRDLVADMKEAQIIIERWCKHYNQKRPYSTLG